MQYSIDSGLLNRIAELATRKRDTDLGTQVKFLSAVLSEDKSMTARVRNHIAAVLTRLRTADITTFEEFAFQVERLCLSVVAHAELNKSLSRALKNFCQERRRKGDVDALLVCHLALVEGTSFKESLDPDFCLDYFLALAEPFTSRGDFADLDNFWQEAVAFSTRSNGPRHKTTADALMLLAVWLRSQGDYSGACHVIGRSIEILRDWKPSREDLLDVLLLLAETAVEGHLTQSGYFTMTTFEDTIHEIRRIIDKLHQPESIHEARLHWLLAQKHYRDRNFPEAIESCRRVLDIYRKLGTEALSERRCLLWLARVYAERNEPDLVESCCQEALRIDKPELGHADELADDLYAIAGFYTNRDEYKRAEALLERALKLKKLAPHHPLRAVGVLERELERVRRLIREERVQTKRALPNLIGDIEGMIGLEEVKTALREHGVYLDFLKLRKERGLQAEEKPVLHAVFTGNPGTGKTTVAKLLGQIYHRLGLLSKGHVHTVVRADLVGAEYAAGEKKTREALNQAKGGVLFIDEAYSLSRHFSHGQVDERDPGQEVVETLLPVLTDPDSDTAIIVAGYPREMESFLNCNPGLRSRFKLHIRFPDYNPPEMLQIALQAAARHQISIEEGAQQILLEKFEGAFHKRNKFFANARYVISIVDDCRRCLGLRIMAHPDPKSLSNDELSLITEGDARTAISANDSLTYRSPINEKLLEQSISDLNSLIGLASVKKSIEELIKVVKLYRELGRDVVSAFKLHAVFTGSPGTGKTTVARILAQIYRALGILEKGHLVECDRASLVGEYIGVTESKTRAKIEEAMGGVLFIDEAYALAGEGRDFGPRAIEVLLKEMEDKRGQFFVILAGYQNEMQQLLDMNPGLRSRIDQAINFEDYNVDELQKIAVAMFAQQDLTVHRDALRVLNRRMRTLAQSKDLANGRSVRKYVDKVVVKHFAKLADVPTNSRTPEALSTIGAELLEQVVPDEAADDRKVGF